jgi:tetratricopeptide (TPR) repeat protein
MPLIAIHQTAELDESPNATVSFDGGYAHPITISGPFSQAEEERLAWYFEEHLRFPFTNQVIARQAAESIVPYGETLFKQIFEGQQQIYAEYKQATQAGLHGLRFDIIGSPAFHQLHWEALRQPGREPFVLHAPMVRRSQAYIEAKIKVLEAPTINLLVVTARPKGGRDVGYRTISRPLLEGLRQINVPVKVDIVRPGTYRALVEHLRRARDERGVGYYQVIHFDLHGAVATIKSLSQVEAGVGSQTYTVQLKNRYGRSDLDKPEPAEAEALKAFLFFEAEAADTLDPAEADELARLLREHQIPIAILNACQSGQQIGATETSLGSRLLQAGVQTVIAMGYSVTVSAAALMMPVLYRSLLNQKDVLVALREARTALHNQPERRAYFNQRIKLEDWLLPVVYQPQGSIETKLPLREMTLTEQAQILSRQSSRYQAPEPTYGFVGRDVDILQIEKHILSHSEGKRRNLLLVRGMGGAGKTTLLHHLGAWWQMTGLVEEIFYFGYDEKAHTAEQIVTEIGRRLLNKVVPPGMAVSPAYGGFQALLPELRAQTLAQRLRSERHLLILDNLESVTGTPMAILNTLDRDEQARLRNFLADLLDGQTLVLLGSRGQESWLVGDTGRPLRQNDVYELPGLDTEAASTLAERILERQVAHEARQAEYRQSDAFQQLLKLLDGYPLPLEVVLANLARQTPAAVLAALRAGAPELDARVDKADPQARTRSIIHCIEYAHGNLDEGAQRLLLSLFPFTGVVWKDRLEAYTQQLREQPPLADLPIERWEEVLETVQHWGLLTPHEIPGYVRLQPILPYFLKSRLGQEPVELQEAIETAFWRHYDGLSGLLSSLLDSKEAQQKQIGQLLMQLEYENVLAALALALDRQASILNPYGALSDYLDVTQEHRRGLEIGQRVLTRLERYPAEALQGQLGVEFAVIIDNIAKRQLLTQRHDLAEASYRRALELFNNLTTLDEETKAKGSAGIYHQLGRVAQEQRQWAQANAYYQQALEIYQEFKARYEQASTYHQLGRVAQEQRQWAQANAYYQQALEIYQEFKARYEQASTYHQLGRVAQEQRQWAQAQQYLLRALTIFAEYDDKYSLGITIRSLARLWQANPNEALLAEMGEILNLSAAEVQTLLEQAIDDATEASAGPDDPSNGDAE